MEISCAFPASVRHLDHVSLAEDLGYRRAWFYDSPALYEDVWMVLALAARATRTIGLGPAVLVPDLRHVLVTASAIATLVDLAPGRVEIAIGTGFTGRRVLGQKPLTWAYVDTFLTDLRTLLDGGQVVVDGKPVQMIHPEGYGPARPIDVPLIVAANGPMGRAVAERVGDGIMCIVSPQPGFERCSLLTYGTILDEGESLADERVMLAAGPAAAAAYHGLYEANPDAVMGLPGGPIWRDGIESIPAETRHLAIHEGHFVHPSDRDRAAFRHDPSLIGAFTWTGPPDDIRGRVKMAGDGGATEILFAPMGPDPERELRRFIETASG
ncbi:MAG: 5,10-methylenetetrahydromethanopterin reductase [Actinomycetota bacterium]|nr:5,10-methylenetetrahydromethanopterin reductase [Actinomycetota bacterium]